MNTRYVIKVGTGVITTTDGMLDTDVLSSLCAQIAALRRRHIDVVLVSSGAVGAGRSQLVGGSVSLPADKQVAAAVGQVTLMSSYAELFGHHGITCAQVLVTKADFRDRTHYLNMRTCFENLLVNGVVPVVNENDVVATSELLFTDNDELAGLVAAQLNVNGVILLTSVAGVLAPNELGELTVVPTLTLLDVAGMKKHILPTKTAFGRGGMLTKFGVAHKLALLGIPTHIACGRDADILAAIADGKRVGTVFEPAKRAPHVKRRVAHSEGLTKGTVYINEGAEHALRSSERVASLLPVGIIGIDGLFQKGDVIEIRNEHDERVGYGLARYGSEHARSMIGVRGGRALVHYNYLFVT
jgi:glutamate 5-kinase